MGKPHKKNAIKQLDVAIDNIISHIQDYTKNSSDFTRKRKLDAKTLIKTMLNMEGQSLNTELIRAFPKLEDRSTSSAYIQQKAKLSPKLFRSLLLEFNKTKTNRKLLDNKYMVFAIDGSDFNMPYHKDSKYVVKASNGRPCKNGTPIKPFCQLHANILFNIMDRTYEDVDIQARAKTDDRESSVKTLKELHINHPYIVIMDRGYESFNVFENCNRLENCNYVVRVKSGPTAIKEIASLPNKECDVDITFKVTTSINYYKKNKDKEIIHTVNRPKKHNKPLDSLKKPITKWDFGDYEEIACRVCKFRINNPETGKEQWEVLVTNLNRFEFPLARMKELYHMRWDIETSFRELKYALGATQFHSRKDDFVEMELYAHLIMFNVVSRCINEIKVPQPSYKKYDYKISFKESVTLVRKYFRLYNREPLDKLFIELLSYTNAIVPGRTDKRNIKKKSAVWFVYRVA